MGRKFIHLRFSTKKKEIALTFDDGPHPVFTPQILTILRSHNIRATFFVSGCRIEKYQDIIKDILADGHQIANHSYYHKNFIFRSTTSMKKDLLKTDRLLRKYGVEGNIPFRPPYGRFDLNTLLLIRKLKKQMILWNVSTKDYRAVSKEQILTRIFRRLKPGSIILMHDGGKKKEKEVDRSFTVQALQEALPQLKNEGYKFVTVNELLIEN